MTGVGPHDRDMTVIGPGVGQHDRAWPWSRLARQAWARESTRMTVNECFNPEDWPPVRVARRARRGAAQRGLLKLLRAQET